MVTFLNLLKSDFSHFPIWREVNIFIHKIIKFNFQNQDIIIINILIWNNLKYYSKCKKKKESIFKNKNISLPGLTKIKVENKIWFTIFTHIFGDREGLEKVLWLLYNYITHHGDNNFCRIFLQGLCDSFFLKEFF